jgi:hypothetical protein
VPGSSGKPVVQKLGIKPGFRVFAVGAPATYDAVVGHRKDVIASMSLIYQNRAPR